MELRGRHGWRTALAAALATACCLTAVVAWPGVARAAGSVYDRDDVISDANYLNQGSMSARDVQVFLDSMPTGLKSLVTTDHAGVRRAAATIIWEASQAWGVSPQIVLATMQKEESLLTTPVPSAYALTNAMGCGVYPGSRDRHPGFGDQVWEGARHLLGDRDGWRPGVRLKVVDHVVKTRTSTGATKSVTYYAYVEPRNASTYSQYRYTPYLSGPKLFWTVYVRYFGDPHADPRHRAVYRFVDHRTGGYMYTCSETQRCALIANSSRTFAYKGVALTWDTTRTATPTSTVNDLPVYRFYNKKQGTYLYTIWEAERRKLLGTKYSATWQYRGVAWRATLDPRFTTPVYRFYDAKHHTYLLTSSPAEKKKYSGTAYRATYSYRGVAFYVAP